MNDDQLEQTFQPTDMVRVLLQNIRAQKDGVWNVEHQLHRDLLEELAAECAVRAAASSKPEKTAHALFDRITDLLVEFTTAARPARIHVQNKDTVTNLWFNYIWFHAEKLVDLKSPPIATGFQFDTEQLECVVSKYLAQPIRSELFSLLLIDALVAAETHATWVSSFVKPHLKNDPLRGESISTLAYFVTIILGGSFIALWFVTDQLLPETTIWIKLVVSAPPLLILACCFAILFITYGVRSSYNKAMRGVVRDLDTAYLRIPKRAPFSPTTLRRDLHRASDKGAVWSPQAFALLDDLDSRVH